MIIFRIIFGIIKIIFIGAIAVFALYNTAAYFDLIPEDFSAREIAKNQFVATKKMLTQMSYENDTKGKVAKYLLGKMNQAEQAYKEHEVYEAEQDAIAAACGESKLSRSIMLLGESEEKKKGCWGKGDPINRAQDTIQQFEDKQQERMDILDSL